MCIVRYIDKLLVERSSGSISSSISSSSSSISSSSSSISSSSSSNGGMGLQEVTRSLSHSDQ